MKKLDLTPKQAKFVDKYLEVSNATVAYRYAYDCSRMKDNSVRRMAQEMLKHPKVNAEIERRIKVSAQTSEITKRQVLDELKNILEANIADYVSYDGQFLTFKSFENLTEKQLKAIESIKQTKHGIELKLHGKSWTVERICKMLGFDAPVKQEMKLDEDSVKLIVGMKVE